MSVSSSARVHPRGTACRHWHYRRAGGDSASLPEQGAPGGADGRNASRTSGRLTQAAVMFAGDHKGYLQTSYRQQQWARHERRQPIEMGLSRARSGDPANNQDVIKDWCERAGSLPRREEDKGQRFNRQPSSRARFSSVRATGGRMIRAGYAIINNVNNSLGTRRRPRRGTFRRGATFPSRMRQRGHL